MTILENEVHGQRSWGLRWRLVRDLLGGALILAVWLGLWAWVAVGVGAPLSRIHGELGGRASSSTLERGA